MSFLILIVLISSEMIMPLAAINFTNTEMRDFERECSQMEQGHQFFESATPLGNCKTKWTHGARCQQNQCVCRGGVLTFGQFADFQQTLLSSDDREGDKDKVSINLSELNTAKGIRNFSTLFGLQKTQSMHAVFGIGNSS